MSSLLVPLAIVVACHVHGIELGKCEPTNYISVNYSTEAKYENFNSNSRRGKVKYLNVTYGNSSKIIKPDEEFTIPANATVDIYLRYNVTNLDDFFASEREIYQHSG